MAERAWTGCTGCCWLIPRPVPRACTLQSVHSIVIETYLLPTEAGISTVTRRVAQQRHSCCCCHPCKHHASLPMQLAGGTQGIVPFTRSWTYMEGGTGVPSRLCRAHPCLWPADQTVRPCMPCSIRPCHPWPARRMPRCPAPPNILFTAPTRFRSLPPPPHRRCAALQQRCTARLYCCTAT